MSVPFTRVYRGTHVESVHRGSIAVVDSRGRLLAFAGDPGTRACIRSAAKPFQALPLLEYGGLTDFDLTGEEIALTCGSHGGEPVHVSTAAALLRKGDFDEEDLLCGTQYPFDEKAAAELRASGDAASTLHNTCSGKHAGMLLAARTMDVPSSRYADPDHPVQVLARSTVAEFAGVDSDEMPMVIDGCGVPAFFLTLHRAAFAYARLMATSEGVTAPGALDRYVESAGHIVEAMTTFPHQVAGNWSITTPLMQAFGGELLAKEGAEGFYAMAIAPALVTELIDRLPVADDCAIGIALKVDDGSTSRGRDPAILRLLDRLGIDLDARPELHASRHWPLRNHAGTLVGEVRAEFELEIL